MRHRRITARALVLAAPLALLALAAALLPGCARKPEAPTWANPFDPANGDPFHATATVVNDRIFVQWTPPTFPGLNAVDVLRALDEAGPYAVIGSVGPTLPSFIDTAFVPNRMNYYKLSGRDADGAASGLAGVTAAYEFAPPYLRIARGASSTATRLDTLSLLTTGGDAFELAATRNFSGSVEVPAGADTVFLVRDLGPAAGNGEFRHVWLRVRTGTDFSLVVHDSIKTMFSPDLQIAGRPATVASPRLTLAIGGAGVDSMRFALSAAGLTDAAWVRPDSVAAGKAWYTADLLGPETGTQTLHGEFRCDFGYSVNATLACHPDNLTAANFALGTGDITVAQTVRVLSSAVATQMRFAESLDALAAAPWRAYADTSEFTLSLVDGSSGTLRRVYGQFANAWFSAVTSDTIRFVPSPGRR
jgi:hypothetical protein